MISITILTKNSTRYLDQVLDSVKSFPEVVVLDSGSTDETLAIAKRYPNVRIFEHHDFDGFGPMHNRASALATYEWIFSVDSDEVVTPDLAQEILALQLNEKTVYSVPRKNYYNGRWIKGCGWYPDRVYRLYHRGATQFSDDKVHEAVKVDGMEVAALKGALCHYSYGSTREFLDKMQNYSDLFAEQHRSHRRGGVCKATLHGCYAFLKSYLFKRGFLDGKEGFVISIYNANTAFYKYLKVGEASR